MAYEPRPAPNDLDNMRLYTNEELRLIADTFRTVIDDLQSVASDLDTAEDDIDTAETDIDTLETKVQTIEDTLASADSVVLAVQTAAPSEPADGTIAYADGSSWNPGDSGEGIYAYYNDTWNKLG